jgi:integrase
MTALHYAAEEYVALRRAGGYSLQRHDIILADFADYMELLGETEVTTAACLGWAASNPASSRSAIAARLSVVRRFCLYLRCLDGTTEVPPEKLIYTHSGRTSPYLYSEAEIAALMGAASHLPVPIMAATFRTLIGLMAVTGLRTSEAIRLGRGDVDCAGNLLTIAHAKNGKSRLVPIHPSTSVALSAYAEERDDLCPGAAPTFFVSGAGTPLVAPSQTFRRLADSAGVTAPPGRRPPRLHDYADSRVMPTFERFSFESLMIPAKMSA